MNEINDQDLFNRVNMLNQLLLILNMINQKKNKMN